METRKRNALLTIAECADQLGCAPLTVRRMISRGSLRAFKIGGGSRMVRVRQADLDRLLVPVTSAADNLGGDDE